MVQNAILANINPKCVHITIEWEAKSVANCCLVTKVTKKFHIAWLRVQHGKSFYL